MPKRKKKRINEVVEKQSGSRSASGGRKTGRNVVIGAVIIALILIIGGAFYYQSQIAPLQQPVITVDKAVVRMDYFLKRAKLTGSAPVTMLQQLADEQLLKLMAPAFGIAVTPREINDALLTTASTGNATGNMSDNTTGRYLTESEFKSWYRQRLKNSGLSDAEYKDITRTGLLAAKLQDYLSQRIPTTAEQVHLNVIVLANSADAAKAKLRIQQGESFAAVAREVSLDAQSKDQGGDIGWVAPGVLPYDSTVFALGIGAVSDAVAVNPSAPTTSQYLLFMVSEKASGRVIDDSSIQVLKNRALSNWLLQEAPSHSIIVNYDFNNKANQAWITWQLSKVSR